MERFDKVRVYFAQTATTLVDAVPESEVEIVIDYSNQNNRPTSVVGKFDCPNLENVHKKEITLDIPARDKKIGSLKFTTPSIFDSIEINVEVTEKAGLFSHYTRETFKEKLIVRMMRQKTLETVRLPEIDKHLDEIAKLSGNIIVVPDTDSTIGIVPIVGDISTNPAVALEIPTTIGLKIQFNLDERSVRSMINSSNEAISVLERVTDDQATLRYFIEQLKRHFSLQGAEVEGPVDDVHVKVGPVPCYLYYATQVSPREDSAVTEKIEGIVELAKASNAFVTVITSRVDSSMIELSKTHKVNFIDVFHGILVKGTWMGDTMLSSFIEKKLGLNLQEYISDAETKGAYTTAAFRDKLDLLEWEE